MAEILATLQNQTGKQKQTRKGIDETLLGVIYFFSFIVNILFHFGVIQCLTEKIGLVLKLTIGTSYVESMNAASNIFLGQAMAPLLIKVNYFL